MTTKRLLLGALALGVGLAWAAQAQLASSSSSEPPPRAAPPQRYRYQTLAPVGQQEGAGIKAYSGVVRTNLWTSAAAAGMSSSLLTGMGEIFACQLDFNRQAAEGDRWRLVVSAGTILVAEYEHRGQLYAAVRFGDGYYAPDGASLKSTFLKSPLSFAKITSGFAPARFHPILHRSAPHLGVDYAAPTGTPVRAIGDGVVRLARYSGSAGKRISLRHGETYRTEYLHLSRFARGIVKGAKVTMGQVIGYVGQSGLATGPHLHFELHDGDRVLDPQVARFPATTPLAESQRASFADVAARALAALPAWRAADIAQAE